MSQFRYDITPVPAGWIVSCNGESGPAYPDRNAAVRDTLAVAETLLNDGHRVLVRLFDLGGAGSILTPADAKLFAD